MPPSTPRSPGSHLAGWLLAPALALLLGCAAAHQRVEQSLMNDRNPASHSRDLESYYRVQYPDVLVIEATGRPDCSGRRVVGLDGSVSLTPQLSVAADGQRVGDLARGVARRLRLPEQAVRVRVAEYHSQRLYLVGEVDARQQVIDYRGPETVLDVLQRVGGIVPGAAVEDVHVVRPHVADGKPPEVFAVNLPAVLSRRDLATNLRLQAGDRIHIGQTRGSRMADTLPPWLKWWTMERPAVVTPP